MMLVMRRKRRYHVKLLKAVYTYAVVPRYVCVRYGCTPRWASTYKYDPSWPGIVI